MYAKKIFLTMSLLLAITLIVADGVVSIGRAQFLFPSVGGREVKPGTHAPKITNTFAIERGYYGDTLKIYIEAEDPDGDIAFIATEINRVEHGRYPTSWAVVKPQYQKNFRGYLQLDTFDFRRPRGWWSYVTLKVSVIDKTWNESNVAVFPFAFESRFGNPEKYSLPAPFMKEDPRLAHIFIFPRGG
jgi:hypothetical protein